jgi:hypothetical protein
MQSLHVPASVLQRIASVVKWFVPAVVTGLCTALVFSFHWIGDRASTVFVADAIADSQKGLKDFEANAHHAATKVDEHERQLAALFEHVVAMQAELVVYREYGKAAADPVRRVRLLEQARKFYAVEYEIQLEKHANDPAEAARRALLVTWEPSR